MQALDSSVDLDVTIDDELMVAHVEGTTELGVEFLDSYIAAELVVVDAGRIIVPQSEVESVLVAARERGLKTS